MNVGKKNILSKKEQRILNKILQDKRNCKYYLTDGVGDFCYHPKRQRRKNNYLMWGTCKKVCRFFEE